MTLHLDAAPAALAAELARLSPADLAALQRLADRHAEELPQRHPAAVFPWHEQQRIVRQARTRWILAVGGNGSGKSAVAKSIMGDVVRRVSPINDRLSGPRDRPLRIWIVPPTLEKARSDWIMPTTGESIRYWLGDLYDYHKESPDIVYFTTRGDQIWVKAQAQEVASFESSEVDLVIFDEEPANERIVNAAYARLRTTNGVLLFTLTPTNGLSWTHRRFYRPLVEVDPEQHRIAERAWATDLVTVVKMGTADNPKAAEFALELAADHSISEAEKNARLYGDYGYVEGVFLPALAGMDLEHPSREHAIYVVDELPKRLTGWYLVADPNRRYGAVLACTDNDGNVFFTREHLEDDWPDRKHAVVFKRWEKEKEVTGYVMMYADTGGAGKLSLINLMDLGLVFAPVEKGPRTIAATVKKLRGLTFIDPEHVHPLTHVKGAPRIYFYRPTLLNKWLEDGIEVTGSRLVWQLGNARRAPNTAPDAAIEKTQKHSWDLFDCARYTTIVAVEIGEPAPKVPGQVARTTLPPDAEQFRPLPTSPYVLPFDCPVYQSPWAA